MSAGQRAETLKAALMQKQLTQLAAAQGQTFNGVLSTLQDTIEQFFGKVGLPLFKAVTAELKHWNSVARREQRQGRRVRREVRRRPGEGVHCGQGRDRVPRRPR
jgi:hypothetical protein